MPILIDCDIEFQNLDIDLYHTEIIILFTFYNSGTLFYSMLFIHLAVT